MHPIGNSGYSLLESIEIPSGHMLAFFSATIRHGAVAKGNGSIAPREMAVSLPSTMTSSYSGAQKV
ncbi:hypothetical protein QMK96_30415, partial [Klebsiella pneumoniae]|uniref:hypothetical protein n=1 Tax=Klebsiella pneumoniae TaxID=573 RepID=UPI003A8B5264